MIITRTPLRVSFLGGGTDYNSWFRKHGGIVIGAAINKYSYITSRFLPPFHDYKSRIVYSAIETVKRNLDIEHRAVKATIQYLGLEDNGYEIFHASDIPGRSGTGSSSAFIVGLVHGLTALHGQRRLPHELMEDAIQIEQVRMGEMVGCQDQAYAAYGGVNFIKFKPNGEISVLPNHNADLDVLEKHLMLMFTGISRNASDVAKYYVPSLGDKTEQQWAMIRLAEQGAEAIYKRDYQRLGSLIDQSWRIKCSFSPLIANSCINNAYVKARVSGAWGGKLIGAGGGGCLLLVAPPEKHSAIAEALPDFIRIPFHFDYDGSVVIFADKENIREYRPEK